MENREGEKNYFLLSENFQISTNLLTMKDIYAFGLITRKLLQKRTKIFQEF